MIRARMNNSGFDTMLDGTLDNLLAYETSSEELEETDKNLRMDPLSSSTRRGTPAPDDSSMLDLGRKRLAQDLGSVTSSLSQLDCELRRALSQADWCSSQISLLAARWTSWSQRLERLGRSISPHLELVLPPLTAPPSSAAPSTDSREAEGLVEFQKPLVVDVGNRD